MAGKGYKNPSLPGHLIEQCMEINERKKMGFTSQADLLKTLMRNFIAKHKAPDQNPIENSAPDSIENP